MLPSNCILGPGLRDNSVGRVAHSVLSSPKGQVAVRLLPHPHFSQRRLSQQLPHHFLVGDGIVGHDTAYGTVELVDGLAAGDVADDWELLFP
jgi:hypothetical protein